MSDTQLTVINNQSVQPYTEPAVSTGLDDTVSLKASNLVLVQPVTREPGAAQQGEYLDTLTGEALPEVTVIPLRLAKGRVLFPEGQFENVEPICRSDDGITPSRYIETPQSTTCAKCPFGQWINGQRPPCNEKFRMLVIRKDNMYPCFINIGGTSIQGYKAAMQKIQSLIHIFKNTKNQSLNLFDFTITLRSVKKKGNKGLYYVMLFEDIKPVETPGQYYDFFQQFVEIPYEEAQARAQATAVAQNNQDIDGVIDAEVVAA